jgi:hypothetical protein
MKEGYNKGIVIVSHNYSMNHRNNNHKRCNPSMGTPLCSEVIIMIQSLRKDEEGERDYLVQAWTVQET